MSNQLWLFASVYAYCLEKGYTCVNYSFFVSSSDFCDNYAEYFALKRSKNIFFDFILSSGMNRLCMFIFHKNDILRNILYDRYISLLTFFNKKKIIYAEDVSKLLYLPPTKDSKGRLYMLEQKKNDIFFYGWFFRNPVGLKKYHKEIVEYFKPKLEVQKRISLFMEDSRKKYSHIVGVHIRRGDYKKIEGGKYCLQFSRINEILYEYLNNFGKRSEDTYFIICSDESIDLKYFAGLNVVQHFGNSVEDLFLLAATDVILGSNSTFSAFASYYGNKPFFVCEQGQMDWGYYRDKNVYFENKYCLFFGSAHVL